MNDQLKTGVYKATKGDYEGAALFLMDVSTPEESEFTYLTIFNPESNESHELTMLDWEEMVKLDGLEWVDDVSIEIKDQYLNRASFAHLEGLE